MILPQNTSTWINIILVVPWLVLACIAWCPRGLGNHADKTQGKKRKQPLYHQAIPILRKLFKCEISMFLLKWFFRLKPPSIRDINLNLNLNDRIFLCPDHSFNLFLAALDLKKQGNEQRARKYLAATLVRRYLHYHLL